MSGSRNTVEIDGRVFRFGRWYAPSASATRRAGPLKLSHRNRNRPDMLVAFTVDGTRYDFDQRLWAETVGEEVTGVR